MADPSICTRKSTLPYMTEVDQAELISHMARFGLRHAHRDELKELLELGEGLTGAPLLTEDELAKLDAATGVSAWATGSHPMEGLLILVPLSEAGLSSVRDGTFTPPSPNLKHICGPHERCFGVYVGIYAGKTHDARRSVMLAAATVRPEFFGTVPCFARAATEDGARSMLSLGYGPVEGGLPDLYCQEALYQATENAA